jgi:hypothetical protein
MLFDLDFLVVAAMERGRDEGGVFAIHATAGPPQEAAIEPSHPSIGQLIERSEFFYPRLHILVTTKLIVRQNNLRRQA